VLTVISQFFYSVTGPIAGGELGSQISDSPYNDICPAFFFLFFFLPPIRTCVPRVSNLINYVHIFTTVAVGSALHWKATVLADSEASNKALCQWLSIKLL